MFATSWQAVSSIKTQLSQLKIYGQSNGCKGKVSLETKFNNVEPIFIGDNIS